MNNQIQKQKNRKMYLLSVAFLAVFGFMCAYLVWFNITKQSELFNNSYNSRQELMAEKNIRGAIFSSDGKKLAYTKVTEEGEERIYPYDDIFCHVIGYDSHGKSGVEALANYELSHSNVDINNKIATSAVGGKDLADNVYTTFDSDLQKMAHKALGVYDGAIVVTEIKTGRILAMVSKPGFDPNEIDSLFANLSQDTKSSVLLNRATQGLYPPGSIFKIITSIEYLRENNNDLSEYEYDCSGSFSVDDIKINCFNRKAHGLQTYEDSVTNSCNSSFANIGLHLDAEAFEKTLNGLLFHQELPIDLPSNPGSFDLVSDNPTEAIIHSSFGQGKTIVTPLQMNLITCAIANDGVLMKPQVLERVETATGSTIKDYEPSVYKRLITVQESEIITNLMEQVVQVGTASKLKGLSYTVAGKTGSAEYDSSKQLSHSWFTGFAPVEDPEIAITIIMEQAGTGSAYAVPVAKRIFDQYFQVD